VNYVLIVLLVAFLILVHELGHLFAALWVKIPLARFSIGFGPALWKRERKGIEYRVSVIPLGGYVLPRIEKIEDYFRVPVGRRLVFSLGGPLFNLLLPLPLFAIYNTLTQGPSLEGIFVAPFLQTWGMLVSILASIPQLFSNAGALSGPIGVVTAGGKYVGFSASKALSFGAFLSLNFAVFNLLPVPVLDGGKIVLALLEKIHPKATRAFIPATVAGLVLLLGLFAWVTVADVVRMAG